MENPAQPEQSHGEGAAASAAAAAAAAPHPPLDVSKYKTKHCRNFSQKGFCAFGETCSFAHGAHELQQAMTPRLKTKLCRHFQASGVCPFAARCGFAHGEAELNTPQPPVHHVPRAMPFPNFGSFDAFFGPKRGPAPELVKTRLCKHFVNTGSCPFEARCLFAHGHNEIRPRMPVGTVPLVQHPIPIVPVGPPAGSVHWSGSQWAQPFSNPYLPSQ